MIVPCATFANCICVLLALVFRLALLTKSIDTVFVPLATVTSLPWLYPF